MKNNGFGTAPVFFTAISTILGAILFLRFGYALGTLGFFGVLFIILLGHLVTIPTAFAISEIATNQRVEGGGEYFIISRSFGLNIGGTIGIALFLSQAISVAFYVIAFTEAFEPLFSWLRETHSINLPRQAISLPAMGLLAVLILTKGANLGVKTLYVVVTILFISLIMFFLGHTQYAETARAGLTENPIRNFDDFYLVFAIIFPAFTGMTAGVGLSGDLREPGKSIPKGTVIATFSGLIIYIFIALKLIHSASPQDLIDNQLIMADVALFGPYIIPLGLAASTISSAIGSVMVAPRTLQALSIDKTIPFPTFNRIMGKGKGASNEPFNASALTVIIAFVFVALGDVDIVAQIISMFFMVTYGSLCLISFLNHFGAAPSYRPAFRSHWALSLVGFLFSVFLMFKIDSAYALMAIIIMTIVYFIITAAHSDRGGLESIFKSTLFQINRNLQIYLQKSKNIKKNVTWHPSAVCVSEAGSDRENAFRLLTWLAHRYGFGSYIQYIQGYYSKAMHEKSNQVLDYLIEKTENSNSRVYVDTIVSPSYTSAIAQIIQLPGISGLENNMILFEFDKKDPYNLDQIVENFPLVHSGSHDVCILAGSNRAVNFREGIHIWVRRIDSENLNLMILLSYIILGHPDWKKGRIKIFHLERAIDTNNQDQTKENLKHLVHKGRLPISLKNIETVHLSEEMNMKEVINKRSEKAGLTMIGFRHEQLKHEGRKLFEGFDQMGDVLFVNAFDRKEIK